MKKFKKLFLCFVLVVVFGSRVLNVNALTADELETINYKFSDFDIFMGEFYSEGTLPNEYSIRNYACWTFDDIWESEYLIGWKYEQPDGIKNGPILKVPADMFEKYIMDSFNVDSIFISQFRENFQPGGMVDEADYITDTDGKTYYQYSLVTGWGTSTSVLLKGVKDLGNNTYQAYLYEIVHEAELEYCIEEGDEYCLQGYHPLEELRIDEDSVLGRDYIVLDHYGVETRYIVLQFYSSKIEYSNGVVKFLSYEAIEKDAVPSDSELTLYTAPEYEHEELKFLDGEKQEFNIEGDSLLTFRIDADYDLFDKVYIDNVLVNPSNYTVKSGSTIITFNKEYTKKLETGEHRLTVAFVDGSVAETTFNLRVGNPETFGNGYEVVILIGLFIGIIIISKRSKKVSL